MSRHLALTVAATFVLVGSVFGSADAASKCTGSKLKAAGKKASSKLGCLAKGIGKGIAADSTCLAKAEVKYSSTVTKADTKVGNDCLTINDRVAIEGKVDTLYSDLDDLVADTPPNPANACDSMKTKAAGKKAAEKLACHAKAVTKGLPTPDSTCLAKAEVKFSKAVAKAETK